MKLLREMLLIRRFEELTGKQYRKRKIGGFCHLYIGQEACCTGTIAALDLKTGEKVALVGENGAGKSTLVKMIYGIMQPDAGQIIWEGQPVQIENPAMARKLGIGMVFQHFARF